jgi:hypothetical protein
LIYQSFLPFHPHDRGGMTFVSGVNDLSKENRRLLVGNINPVNLIGLRQALYVLQSLENGNTAGQIIDKFQGDGQLVEIWINFLIHNQWVERTKTGEFSATEKGKDWRVRIKDVEVS